MGWQHQWQDHIRTLLPQNCVYYVHHVTSKSEPCEAIYASRHGHTAEATQCQSHFLSLAVEKEEELLQVLAIETFVYSSQRQTTVFVSKADSTGCYCVQNDSRNTSSPLWKITGSYLQHLARSCQKQGRQVILSLFARAQNQYLFPASMLNRNKHILDDRQLIRWWSRAVGSLLAFRTVNEEENRLGKAFLRVPGYDDRATRAFFPQGADDNSWQVGDPLQNVSGIDDLPIRCLIPRFPDDPKARFAETLDEEVTGLRSASINDDWRSVRSLDQFWEAMSYRQECSAGRLVGFLSVVFDKSSLALDSSYQSNDNDLQQITLNRLDYNKLGIFLLDLDYTDEVSTARSTQQWIQEATRLGQRTNSDWGVRIVGEAKKDVTPAPASAAQPVPTLLDMGVLRKKKRFVNDGKKEHDTPSASTAESASKRARQVGYD